MADTWSSPTLPGSCCTLNPNKPILQAVAGGADPSGGPQPIWTVGVEAWRVFFGVEAPQVAAVVALAKLGLFVFVPAIVPLKAERC